MSLRNEASNDSHHNPKEHLDNNLSSSESKARSSPLKPSHSIKFQKEPSSSKHNTQSTGVRTSPSRRSYSSLPTSVSTSTINVNNAHTTNTSHPFTRTEIDLLQVSAWTHNHSDQSPHDYQSSNFTYPSHNGFNTSMCPYHTSIACLDHETTQSYSGYGSAPLERWLEEGASDGGALALQLELQPRVDCNCIASQDNMF